MKKLDNSCGYDRRFTDDSYGYAQKFTDDFQFFQFFSDFLRFSLRISFFLRIFAPKNPLPHKGCGVIIFKKVLKNDAALPSAMDSRAFLPFYHFTFKRLPFKQIDYLTITTYSHDRAEYLLDKNNILSFKVHVLGILAYLASMIL